MYFLSSDSEMIRRLFKRSFGVSIPCAALPAGIEILTAPQTITLLIPFGSRLTVAEGQPVAMGECLCAMPQPGTFSSVRGIVDRIYPWDCGTSVKHTAVTVAKYPDEGNDVTNKRRLLFEPSKDPSALSPEVLRERCAFCGFYFPEKNTPLLVTMLDEDIDRTANRWYFEKEFDRILAGCKLVRRMLPETVIVIAVPDDSPVEKKSRCGEWGRVITRPPRYPEASVNCIMLSDMQLHKAPCIAVIDAKRLAALMTSLTSGYAGTSFPLSFKHGAKGASKLYLVPAGMTVGHFLAQVDISAVEGMRVVVGGEMTGTAVHSLSQPLTSVAESLLVIAPDAVTETENNACVNCGKCVRACPAGLRVDLLGKCVERGLGEEAVRLGIRDCIGCGLCTAVCIVRRPLAHLLAFGKTIPARNNHPGEVAFPTEKTIFPDGKATFPTEKTIFPDGKATFPAEKTIFPEEKAEQ
jgi:ferredoxin